MKLACTHALTGAFVIFKLGVMVTESVTAAKFGLRAGTHVSHFSTLSR